MSPTIRCEAKEDRNFYTILPNGNKLQKVRLESYDNRRTMLGKSFLYRLKYEMKVGNFCSTRISSGTVGKTLLAVLLQSQQ